jgi:hypothetical protein
MNVTLFMSLIYYLITDTYNSETTLASAGLGLNCQADIACKKLGLPHS